MSKRPRRTHSAAFKAKVALAALKGDKTLAELAQHAVITTNYDELLEPLFPEYERVIGQQILRKPYLAIGEIFKIHGCRSQPKSLVLNEADYQRFQEDHKYLSAKLLT